MLIDCYWDWGLLRRLICQMKNQFGDQGGVVLRDLGVGLDQR